VQFLHTVSSENVKIILIG